MSYTWSFDRDAEIWGNEEYDTVEACLYDAKGEARLDESQMAVYIGECVPFLPEADCTDILDRLEEQAGEMCGEVGGDWDAYNWNEKEELQELNDSLTTVVCDWLKKYGYYPGFYAIQNIREYLLMDCNKCKNISLTEADQTDNRQLHVCKYYGVRVYHGALTVIHSPILYPCKECRADDFGGFITTD